VIERCKKGEARRPVRISQFQNKLKACKSLILQAFLFLYLPKLLQFSPKTSEWFSESSLHKKFTHWIGFYQL